MTAVWTLLGLILAGLQAWLAAAPQRKLKDIKDDDEALRKACLELDAADITIRIGRVLHPPSGSNAR